MTSSRWTFLGLVLIAPVSAARGQDELFSIEGATAGDQLGGPWGIAPLGDVDGDGVPDFAVGARNFDGVAGADCGRVQLLSGKTRAVLWSWEGENAGDNFGFTVQDAQDIDGDGLHDVAISALGYPGGLRTGKVYVYSSATGALIWSWTGENADDRFVYMRGVGDATGDGVNDLLITAYDFDSVSGSDSGKAYLYSGADGSLFNSWLGASQSQFGFRIARLGFDADGDGCADFAIGSYEYFSNGPGHVYVYSGKSQTPIVTFTGANNGDALGYTDDAGDVDGDGIPDLLVNSPYAYGSTGVVYLYSGRDWSVLLSWIGTSELPMTSGFAVVGDVDGDGFGDIVDSFTGYDGPAGVDSGIIRLFSGANGRELTRWYGDQAYAWLGSDRTVGAGDLDGDGHPDLLAGEENFDGAAGVDCGKVMAFQGNDLYLNVEPAVASAGDTLTLTTTAGVPGNLVVDVVTELDGVPMFQLLTPVLAFDANGELVISGVVDPSVGAHVVQLRSYAIGRSGKLIESTTRTLTLQ